MSYTTAVVTSDAAPSTTLMTAIEGALTTHTAWDFVEERVSGSYTFRVWKCSGTYNSQGSDFYVGLCRTTSGIGTASINVVAFEGYNSGTGLVTRAVPPRDTSSFTPDATYHAWPSGTGVALSTLVSGTNAPINTSTITFTYRIFVSKDRLILRTSLSTADFCHVGLFEPYGWPGVTTEFPLVLGSGLGNHYVSFSRCPHRGTVASRTRPGINGTWVASASSLVPVYGTNGTTYTGLYTGAVAGRMAALDGNANTGVYGSGYRGWYRGWVNFNEPAGYVEGDTVTIDSVQHVRLTNAYTWISTED